MAASEPEFVNRNLDIERLPAQCDRLLNTLAKLRGMTKKALVREALVEYTNRHAGDVAGLARGGRK